MVYAGLKLEGGRNLRRTLREAGSDLTELKAANAQAASIVAGRAQSWAPVVSGRLAATVRSSGTKTAGIVRAGNNRKSASGVPYAAPIHWGWKARNIRANPFLSYSAQSTEPTWLALYESLVNTALSKIKGK
ncbi:TPA: HK97 gp10 family phage protein [Corynebacterium striatum]|uniref:HK97 gp10 family phage protein n=1 Tax=Corynebacterium striatum TaxID=43770 RepID=UPI001A35C9F8|nr:HK97 gp10 family phage protein [Corynebacterium striatum]HAT1254312.1 HK97 gp10 family phage protein [Corynebacterium striatum]HAT1266555.1 HK97 gp10 family phage protein [Corynebacterium striatum]HAT1313582.1 HK97 gp10 family phage protein [Corynebacterium striatum]HAT1318915.1 HK97 gp10 family phage protein [Corynebacterium striatum]